MIIVRRVISFFRKHFFAITILVLSVLLAGSSYLHFMIQHDYLISFEGNCDPYTESCFEECEDDACTETYFYSIIERGAAETIQLCDTTNVTECDAAYECQPNVEICSITFCDPEIDGEDTCVRLTEESS